MKFQVIEYDKSLDYEVLSEHPTSHAATLALRSERRLDDKRLLAVLQRPEPPAIVSIEAMLDLWDEFCGGTGYYHRGYFRSRDPALPFVFRFKEDHPICGTMLKGWREETSLHVLVLGLRTWKREVQKLWKQEFLDRAAVDPLVIQKINADVAKYLARRPKKKRRVSKKEALRLRKWWFAIHKPKKS